MTNYEKIATLTQQEKTDLENREYCQRIAEELDQIAEGNMYKCPECDGVITVDPDELESGCYTCPECGERIYLDDAEPYTMYDYFADCFDIEYRIDANREYRSVQIMVACGGPNVYVDTAAKEVQLYWWPDRASYRLLSDTAEAIDEVFEEYYNC